MTDDMDALRVSGGGTTGDMDALRVSGDSMTDDMDALRVSGGGVTGDMDALRRRLRGRKPGLLGATRAYAVLCPLLDGPGGPELLYEVRAAGIRQPGEVCFP
ncbi:MAG: hypothetical protein IJT31_06900, partial [Oscillibacter sp.]|nr:hypothetical protein [Oscillibacter sp.]